MATHGNGFGLFPPLFRSEAGERYCALTTPELYYVLTVEFGWTADQHRKWVSELLETELLEPPLHGGGLQGTARRPPTVR